MHQDPWWLRSGLAATRSMVRQRSHKTLPEQFRRPPCYWEGKIAIVGQSIGQTQQVNNSLAQGISSEKPATPQSTCDILTHVGELSKLLRWQTQVGVIFVASKHLCTTRVVACYSTAWPCGVGIHSRHRTGRKFAEDSGLRY